MIVLTLVEYPHKGLAGGIHLWHQICAMANSPHAMQVASLYITSSGPADHPLGAKFFCCSVVLRPLCPDVIAAASSSGCFARRLQCPAAYTSGLYNLVTP